MATAEQFKALIRSHLAHGDEQFRSVALQIAAHTARKGNVRLAEGLQQLIDEARQTQAPAGRLQAVPIARPSGQLSGLVTASYPTTRLADMVLPDALRDQLKDVVHQHRQADLLRTHGLVRSGAPASRLSGVRENDDCEP